jgi:hypothetical protein
MPEDAAAALAVACMERVLREAPPLLETDRFQGLGLCTSQCLMANRLFLLVFLPAGGPGALAEGPRVDRD